MEPSTDYRARLLRDQVLKTWSPPCLCGNECKADIAQTAVMQTLAYVMGRGFLTGLTPVQQQVIDEGLVLFERAFAGHTKSH